VVEYTAAPSAVRSMEPPKGSSFCRTDGTQKYRPRDSSLMRLHGKGRPALVLAVAVVALIALPPLPFSEMGLGGVPRLPGMAGFATTVHSPHLAGWRLPYPAYRATSGGVSASVAPPPLQSPTWVSRSAAIAHLPFPPGMMAYDPALGETIALDAFDRTTWAFSNGGWTNVTPSNSPPPREFGGLAYDADAHELVLFGGQGNASGGLLNDTWVYRGGNWLNLTNPSDPPPSAFFGLATDVPDNGVLLYGGLTGSLAGGASHSTWLFGGTGWRNVSGSSTGAPPASVEAGLAYDSIDRQVVLFGGLAAARGTATYPNDTWTYSGGVWTNRSVAGPSPRLYPSLSDDPTVGGIFLFGGAANGTTPLYRNDSWIYHGGLWAQTALSGPAPRPRELAGLAWDTGAAEAVLNGGLGLAGFAGSPFQTDTWTFQGGTWKEVQSSYAPGARFGEVMAATLDSPTSAVQFGGANGSTTLLNDTWSFSRDTWQEHRAPGAPPGRTFGMFASDPLNGSQVLFGGSGTNRTVRNDTWIFDASAWTNRTTGVAPSPRYAGVFVYDPGRGADILFGGVNATNVTLNDTWSFLAGRWSPLSPASAPPARVFASATYDPVLGGIVVFGGSTNPASLGTGLRNDSWLFANGTWTLLPTSSAPPPRYGAALSFDARLGSVVAFGGWVVPNSPYQLNDTWVYAPGGWHRLTVHASPPPLGFSHAWWDPLTNATWRHAGNQFNAANGSLTGSTQTVALDLLTANATVSGTGGPTPYVLNFSATALNGGAPYGYSWALAGAISTATSGAFAINSIGTYTLYLNVTDSWGVVWHQTFGVNTTPGPLTATLRASPTAGSAPVTVHFSGAATGGAPPYTFAWDFGDGTVISPGVQSAANHTYLANQTFTATLTVKTVTGATITASTVITLQSSANSGEFGVHASVTPLSGPSPLNVSYTAVPVNGTPPYRYAWAFGDGDAASVANGSHTFVTQGRFTILVNVTNGDGTIVGESFTLTVNAPGPSGSQNVSSSLGFGGLPWWAWAVITGLALALVVAGGLIVRQRRRPPAELVESPALETTLALPPVPVAPMPWEEDAGPER
jgi:PKD repeat protein